MTTTVFQVFAWLCFLQMLKTAFGNPSCSQQMIRVAMKNHKMYGYNFYTGEIALGTPPQTFNVFVDVSSADFAIRSSASSSSAGSPVYDSSKSTTFTRIQGKSANVTSAYSNYNQGFGDNTFGKGFISSDWLKIKGATVKQQQFVEMTTFGSTMKFYGSFTDGKIGLAYPLASSSGTTPFFQNMLRQGIVSNPIFAITSNTTSSDLELTLGGMDPTKFRGLPTWTPVIEKRYWKFSVPHLLVKYSECNVTQVNCNGPKGCQMVIDSSGDGIYGSDEVLSRVFPLMGTKDQGVPCRLIKSLPDIGFNIGGNDFYMTPQQYMIGGSRYDHCINNPSSSSSASTYFFAWTPRDIFNDNSEVWILGLPFLRAVNIVFDFGKDRIGFTPNN